MPITSRPGQGGLVGAVTLTTVPQPAAAKANAQRSTGSNGRMMGLHSSNGMEARYRRGEPDAMLTLSLLSPRPQRLQQPLDVSVRIRERLPAIRVIRVFRHVVRHHHAGVI